MSNKMSVLLVLLMLPAVSWSQTRYVVKRGDTLLKVADRTLGNTDRNNPRRYELARKIQEMNPELKDPNTLEVGQTILLPGSSTKAKSSAHANHSHEPEAQTPAANAHDEHAHAAPDAASTSDANAVHASPIESAQAPSQPSAHASTSAHAAANAPGLVGRDHPVVPAKDAHAREVHGNSHGNSHGSEHPNFFFVQPRYHMVSISATDLATKSKVSMKSKASFGLDVQYGKVLNSDFHLLFQAGVTHTQFDKIEGTGAKIDHDRETLKSFAAGIAYEATSHLHLDLMFMGTERTFIIPDTAPNYALKAIMIPGAELNISLDLYRGTSNIFGVSAIGEYLTTVAKDTVEYKSAVEPLAALYWKSNFGHDRVNYKATLIYKKGHQGTSLTEQHEDMTALGVGFYF